MRPHRWHRWPLSAALTLSLSSLAGAFQAEPPGDRTPASPCAWMEQTPQRALAQVLGDLSVHEETVASVAQRLKYTHHVPLSFIASDEDPKITFALPRPTVRAALDKVLALAPIYRLATIHGHLVLYPRDSKWETRLEDLHIGTDSRRQVTSQLAKEIRRRLPALAIGPIFSGPVDPYVLQDRVSVEGSGSVVELLVQLLGTRPPAVFWIEKDPPLIGDLLTLGGVRFWQDVALASPTHAMRPGEIAQLKVVGMLLDGTRREVTAGTCGTVYRVSDERVATVSTDGLLTAHGPGQAWIQAGNAGPVSIKSVQVVEPGPRTTGGGASPPRGTSTPPSRRGLLR
jgi:hypothetical protein